MLDDAASEPEWISAHETHELVHERNRDPDAALTITNRAHSGLVRTRASLFIRERDTGRGVKEKLREENVDLPREFWWAKGHAALEQNWTTGDFGTWIERTYLWQAFGVQFRRPDVEAMLRSKPIGANVASLATDEEPIETVSNPVPSDDEIRNKMIELHEKGVTRDVAAKLIRDFPGFERVGNEHARRVAAGNLALGRPKSRQDK